MRVLQTSRPIKFVVSSSANNKRPNNKRANNNPTSKDKKNTLINTVKNYQKEDVERLKTRSEELKEMIKDMSEIGVNEINDYVKKFCNIDCLETDEDEDEDEYEEVVANGPIDVEATTKNVRTRASNLDDFDDFIDVITK